MSNLTVGKIANNSVTLLLNSRQGKKPDGTDFIAAGNVGFNAESKAHFRINLSNVNGFPHKTRCLCQVQSVRLMGSNGADEFVGSLGVEIREMAPHTLYDGTNGLSGFVGTVDNNNAQNATISQAGTTFVNYDNFLDSCVVCQSPFGKQLSVRLVDTKTGNTLAQARMAQEHITIKLRLLFLDNEDLKDF